MFKAIARYPKLCIYCALCLLFSLDQSVIAQVTGGQNSFQYALLNPSSRISALGGYALIVEDAEVADALRSPSAYSPAINSQISINHAPYVSGIQQGYLGYAHTILDSLITIGGGVQYLSYGQFQGNDVAGNSTGTFSGGGFAFVLGAGSQYKRLQYGANLKFLSHSIESYSASAIAADLSVAYFNPETNFSVTLAAINLGSPLKNFLESDADMPFDLRLGISKSLKYLPFRFFATAHHLHQWDIRYDDPAMVDENADFIEEENTDKNYTFDKLFRHISLGGELSLGKALRIRFGYDHLTRSEMNINGIGGMAGFSFGTGLDLKRFNFSYAYSSQHRAAGIHHISFNWRLKLQGIQ